MFISWQSWLRILMIPGTLLSVDLFAAASVASVATKVSQSKRNAGRDSKAIHREMGEGVLESRSGESPRNPVPQVRRVLQDLISLNSRF